jgi:thiol-disulfide isomerase/thioredoxin
MKAGIVIGSLLVLIVLIGPILISRVLPKAQFSGGAIFDSSPNTSITEDKKEVENVLTIDSNLAVGSDSSAVSETDPYQEYSKATFDASAEKKTRILFFYADWCPTCRPVDADIKANLNKIPRYVQIIRVNYNDDFTDADEKALAQKYGVTYQHTFVRIDSTGNELDKWNGGGLQKLLEYIKSISPSSYERSTYNGPIQQ